MKKSNLLVVVISVLFVFAGSDAFSAWTQPKGYSYNQLTLSYYRTTDKYTTLGFDANGKIAHLNVPVHKKSQPKFTSTKVTYYGEYGITDKLTIFTSIPYDWQKSDDTIRFAGEDGPYGVGDINIGLRQKLADNIAGTGVLMSIQGTLKIPEAYDYGDPTTHLSLGNGQYDAILALLLGRGLGKGYAWANAGYKFRFENDEFAPATFTPSDQINVSFGGGYAVTSWLSIRGLVSWIKSVGNAEVSPELVALNFSTGGLAEHNDVAIIKDSLGLEPDALSVGIDLAFTVSSFIPLMKDTFPSKQIVFSYNREVKGFGVFQTRDFSSGRTYSVAFVFPGKGLFPVNLFAKK